MTEVQRMEAEIEALRITFAALFQSMPQQWKDGVRANVASVRRHTSNSLLRVHLNEEQIERIDETILALTWMPPDVQR
jgi:hypothetical protein